MNFRDGTANTDKSFYYDGSNILNVLVVRQFPFLPYYLLINGYQDCIKLRNENQPVKIGGGGIHGYCSGPDKILIDPLMITEPLLARLPNIEPPKGFRIGHIVKKFPKGLKQSYENGYNSIVDPELRNYYHMILTITRGNLFSLERFKYIYKILVFI